MWHADYDTNLDQHGTPLYIDGVLYVSTAWNKVYAFDAKTGKQLWQYNLKVPGEWLRNACCGNVSRGIAAFNGKIYIGTMDARLVALDAKTGKEAWVTDTILGDHSDPLNRYSITMAPRIAKGKVFIGASGAASTACAAGSRPSTPRPASRYGASTMCLAIRRRASRTEAMKRRPRHGAASGGSSVEAPQYGMRPSMIPTPTLLYISAPATARRGTRRSATRSVVTIPTSPPSWR